MGLSNNHALADLQQESAIKLNSTHFSAAIKGGSFSIKIDKYEPALVLLFTMAATYAISLQITAFYLRQIAIMKSPPYTGSLIENQPITLIAHDSLYEYDLNHSTDECVYETAWGKDVWRPPLSEDAINTSKAKHVQFYRVLSAFAEALVENFAECIVYDNHSYNFKRHERKGLPVFNVGTSSVKNEKWRPVIDRWVNALKKHAYRRPRNYGG